MLGRIFPLWSLGNDPADREEMIGIGGVRGKMGLDERSSSWFLAHEDVLAYPHLHRLRLVRRVRDEQKHASGRETDGSEPICHAHLQREPIRCLVPAAR